MKIALDGNIGCGKTTIMDRLSPEYLTTVEPVKKWKHWLDKFYKDPHKYAFHFQLRILYDQHKYKYEPNEINLYERSPYTLKNIFGEMLAADGTMDKDETDLHNSYVDILNWKPDYIIYIFSLPETCYERIIMRDPDNTIPMEYIKRLHTQHEMIFDTPRTNIPIYKVNGDDDIDQVEKTVRDIIGDIKCSHSR